jgi:hypothetical protein
VTTGNFNIGVYPLNGSWNEYDATWNNTYYLEGSNSWIYVAFTNAANSATINNPKPINVPLTSLAQEWARDPDSNNGVKLKYENGSNYSVCLRSSESGSTYSPRFYITYEVKGLSSGVYTLTSAATSEIAYYPDHKAGSNIRQTTSPAELLEEHLFKFCYLGNVEGEDYYTIRPMTNNGLGLAVMDSAGTVKAKEISATNDWDDISETERWSVKFVDGYYQIRNGASETGGYLSVLSASNSAPDHLVVNATATSNSSWTLREQQGDKSEAVFVNPVSEMHLDSQSESEVVLDFLAVARSYDSAENGPVQYFVTNENGETTDRAEFIDGNGKLRIYKPGIIKVGATITDENEAIWVTVYIYKTVRSIEFLHDEGYAIRYSGTNGEENAQARIGILLDDLFVWYMNNLGVKVVWPALSDYTSYADECGEGYDVEVEPGDFPDMPCSCGADCQNGEMQNGEWVKSLVHHKNFHNVVLDFHDRDSQYYAAVLFSGHKCCYISGKEHYDDGSLYGLSNAELAVGCVADRYGTLSHERFTTIHEVGHLFGASDHYDTVNNGGDDSRYSTEEMNNGDPNGPYKDECIYGLNWRNYTSGELDTIRICDGCRNDMLSYLGMAETE